MNNLVEIYWKTYYCRKNHFPLPSGFCAFTRRCNESYVCEKTLRVPTI